LQNKKGWLENIDIINNHINLRYIKVSDTADIIKWRNSLDVKRNLYTQDELTEEQHIGWFKNVVEIGACSQFIIEHMENNGGWRSAGTVYIKNIDRQNRKGEFGIFIGEQKFRGKGLASQATKLILAHAFEELQLNRVYLTVFHDNIPAIKAYESAGFEREGLLKQDFLRYDGFCDILYMGITLDKWLTLNA